MIYLPLAFLDSINKWLTELCSFFTNIWNSLIDLVNFLLGVALNPIGFLWWLVMQGLVVFAGLLPDVPTEMTLDYVINQIGNTTSMGTGMIKELVGIVGQFLLIVAIVKIYKLIPFKAT